MKQKYIFMLKVFILGIYMMANLGECTNLRAENTNQNKVSNGNKNTITNKNTNTNTNSNTNKNTNKNTNTSSTEKSSIKNKNTSNTTNKEKLNSKVKVESKLKDGPISWANLNADNNLAAYLRNERTGPVDNILNFNGNVNSNSNSNSNQLPNISNISNNTQNTSYNKDTSENTKSKTFRTVGPYDDTTKNYDGQKYSNIYKLQGGEVIKSGYYGKSRHTRF